MEIVENVRTERFGDIKVGQCFRHNQSYYMRIDTVMVKGVPTNVVNMKNGLLSYFTKEDIIIHISCKMVVE